MLRKTYIQMAGITTIEDALMCVEAGVDIIGLLVGQKHSSFEFISKELAKEIKDALPKGTKTTLITHLTSSDEIIETAKYIGVNYIQFHSNIQDSEVVKVRSALPKVKIIRLIHILKDGTILTDLNKIKMVDIYFTDSINVETNQVGGTGQTHNFDTDKSLVEGLKKHVIIAGGLTPNNVADVIKHCKPFGVDVNSGCRRPEGGRDRQKVKAFVESVRNVEL